ncbi:metal-dependent transcriptional regulator [Corynebacterium sp. 335C]
MHLEDLTDSAQNYLKALWALSEWEAVAVTPSMLCDYLNLKPSSVSDQIRRLTKQGLVDHARYGSISLTPEGRELAVQMIRRHRLLETFLHSALDYGWDEVHDDAERLEHAVSERLLERIDAKLGHPTRDPHGDVIPAADGTIVDADAQALTSLAAGDEFVVRRISDLDPGLLRHLEGTGVLPGTRWRLADAGVHSGVLVLSPLDAAGAGSAGAGTAADADSPAAPATPADAPATPAGDVPLGREAAEAIRVRVRPRK